MGYAGSNALGVSAVNATDGTSCRAGGSQAGAGAHPSGAHSWADLAAGAGCPESLGAVAQVDPGALSGAELIEAIVASEKALSLLAARQMGLLTEFARPSRAGDVSELVAELMDKGGQGRRPDGEIDLDTVETLVQERQRRWRRPKSLPRCRSRRSPRIRGSARRRICAMACRRPCRHWLPVGSIEVGRG